MKPFPGWVVVDRQDYPQGEVYRSLEDEIVGLMDTLNAASGNGAPYRIIPVTVTPDVATLPKAAP